MQHGMEEGAEGVTAAADRRAPGQTSSGLFPTLRGYRRSWLRPDVIAGVTLWAVTVPQAFAYASIAGAPLVLGLYAVPAALFAYALVGTSGQLNMGPMSSMAAMSAATVAQFAALGSEQFTALTVALAITTGVVGLVAALLRLGFLASFISEPIMMGYMAGLALNIIVGQLPSLFGVEGLGATASMGANFFQQLAAVIGQLGETVLPTFAIGLLVAAIILVLKRVSPVLPAALIAVGVAIVAGRVFSLADAGVETIGTIPAGLPSFGLPTTNFFDYLQLAPGAIGILIVGYAEGLGVARTYAARQQREIDPGRELVGIGLANVAAGLSSGMIVNGSVSRSAINAASGAKTQLASLFTAALTVVTLVFLTGMFEGMPRSALAGVVIAAVWDLVDVRMLRMLYAASDQPLTRVAGILQRPDFLASLGALLGVLVFGNLEGLIVGVGISLVLILSRVSRPRIVTLGRVPGTDHLYGDVDRNPESETEPGMIILRVDGGIFFVNAGYVRDEVRRAATQAGIKAIVLDMQTVPWTDVTGVHMLDELADDLAQTGVRLAIARSVGEVRDLQRREVPDLVRRNTYPSVPAAVRTLRRELTGS